MASKSNTITKFETHWKKYWALFLRGYQAPHSMTVSWSRRLGRGKAGDSTLRYVKVKGSWQKLATIRISDQYRRVDNMRDAEITFLHELAHVALAMVWPDGVSCTGNAIDSSVFRRVINEMIERGAYDGLL
jgi:hypothetical protein